MKKTKMLSIAAVIAVSVGAISLFFGDKIKMLYISLNSFKDKNLAHTFQHTPEIQPTKKISKGANTFQFQKEVNGSLPDSFTFEEKSYSVKEFLEDTKTLGFLVIQDDVIKFEEYYMGGDENTLFSSNSMGKSFVSALMGIAISEGYVNSVEDPIGNYIPEFVGTELKDIPIKACLQMASGINFDEDHDMSRFSIRTLIGNPAKKVIARYGKKEETYT